MMDCAIVGDSIALGVATEIHRCVVDATVGITSAEVIGRVKNARVLVISAGSNDARSPDLENNLRAIRSKAHGTVIWISPMDKRAAMIVQRVARAHGDKVVHFTPREDNIHPKSYDALADRVDDVIRHQPGV